MLTKADSNIGIPDIDGKTPLHWAASSKDSQAVDCVQLILVSAQHEIYEKFAKCTHVKNVVCKLFVYTCTIYCAYSEDVYVCTALLA